MQKHALAGGSLHANLPPVAANDLTLALVKIVERQFAADVRNAHGDKRGFIRLRLLLPCDILLRKEPIVVDWKIVPHSLKLLISRFRNVLFY